MLYRTDDYPFFRITEPLLKWYRKEQRILPWRENNDAYRVWVSEIMLQQTRVEAAKEYYIRFLNALPTVFDLAACEEEKLLKLWEGLGYYSRARNLQKTAKIIVESYGGQFPKTKKELLALPGIGEYTAGAILSIAHYLPTPAVDGNVFRVISRLTENPTDISEPKYRAYLTEKLEGIYPKAGRACSEFTQSLMELGAMVCKPQSPDCELCPLKSICRSFANGTQESYPVLPAKKEKRKEQVTVLLILTDKGIAIRKRETGVLKGMNEFPSFMGKSKEESLKELGVENYETLATGKFTHIFTHIAWDMTAYLIKTDKVDLPCYLEEELDEKISLPTAFKQCQKLLKEYEKISFGI